MRSVEHLRRAMWTQAHAHTKKRATELLTKRAIVESWLEPKSHSCRAHRRSMQYRAADAEKTVLPG